VRPGDEVFRRFLNQVFFGVTDPVLFGPEPRDMGVNTHEEIEQLFLELQAARVTFSQPFRKEPWGAKTFIVKDPDGNLLLFAGPAD
jgi:uncharacterized glyoxalase superfamily protein PhnB